MGGATAPEGLLRLGAAGTTARVACVFVHGRGQTPEDMVAGPVAGVVDRAADASVAWFLPCAPSKSWYAAKAVDALTDITRAELAQSLVLLGAVIAEARAQCPGVPLVLGGFSQGACLSLEHAFAGHDRPDALVALTGCRVGNASDARPTADLAGLPVYLSGGDVDPWIPLAAFAETALALGTAGARLRAEVFPGRPHAVSDAEMVSVIRMLSNAGDGQAATDRVFG